MSDILSSLAKLSNLAFRDVVNGPRPASRPSAPVAAPTPASMPTAAALAQITQALSDPNQLTAVTLSNDRGNALTAGNQILQDQKTLDPIAFDLKYGPGVADQVARLTVQGDNNVRDSGNRARSGNERVGDDLIGVGSGLVQGIGGLTQLAAIPIGKKAGAANAELFGRIKDFTDSAQSAGLARSRQLDAVRAQLDGQENQARFEQDRKTDGELVASLRSFGRDVISGAKRLGEDPALLEEGVAEGIGSTLLGGPLKEGIVGTAGLAERAIMSRLGAQAAGHADELALLARQAAGLAPASGELTGELTGGVARVGAALKTARGTVDRAAFPAAIGALEGGGAKQQTEQQILATPDEQLLEQSPRFQLLVRDLMAKGAEPQDALRQAKVQLADEAGNVALAVAAPTAVLTSKLVEHYEGDPARLFGIEGGAASVIPDALKETVEESLQSGVGQLAQNLGVETSGANPDQNLAEGVGSQALQGGLFGGLGAGVVSGPGAVVSDAARLAKFAGNKVWERGVGIVDANRKASPVSEENAAQGVAAAAASAPSVGAGLQTLAAEFNNPTNDNQDNPADDTTVAAQDQRRADVETYVQKVQDASKTTPQDLRQLPPSLTQRWIDRAEAQGGPLNKFETLAMMAKVAGSENETEADRISAATFLIGQLEDNHKLFNEDYPDFLDNVPHDRPEFQQFQHYAGILDAVRHTPSIRQAMAWARTEMAQSEAGLDQLGTGSAEEQQLLANTVALAEQAPQAANPKVVADVLAHADRGDVELSPEQLKALRGVQAMHQAVHQAVQEESSVPGSKEAAKPSLADQVSQQIETSGGDKAHQRSLADHTQAINQAAASGDPARLQAAMNHLQMFAQAMRNKVAALNQSIANGDGKNVPYESLDKSQNFFTDKKGIGVIVGNTGSETFARQVHADAYRVIKLANNMAATHPEVGQEQMTLPKLALDQTQRAKAPVEPKVEAKPNQKIESPSAKVEEPKQLELPLPEPVEAEPVQARPAEDEAAATQPVQEKPARQESTSEKSPVTSEAPKSNTENPSDHKSEIEQAFPRLIQAGKNLFHKAFRFPQEQTSKMLGFEKPLQGVYDLLGKSAAAIVEFMGKEPKYDVDLTQRQALQDLLEQGDAALKAVNRRLKTALTEKPTSGPTLLQLLNRGDAVNRFVRGRALNILDKTQKGYRYNQQLIEAALVAALDWLLTASDRINKLDAEDVAKIMGIDEDLVTQAHIQEFNRGLSLDEAARTLGERIREFWGLETVKGVSDTYVRGIPEAVAKELLHGLHEAGLLHLELGVAFPDITVKTFNRIWLDTRSEKIQEIFKEIGGAKKLLGDLALVQNRPQGVSVGEKLGEPAKTQLRNPMVKNKRQQLRALEHEQNVPYLPNFLVGDFVRALGERGYMLLMGGREFEPGDLNAQHELSVDGKNRGLISAHQNLMAQLEQVRAVAKQLRIRPEEVATYYEHQITKVGRMQMMGLNNPQGDKLARELFMPTKSTLDLSGNGPDFEKFAMTIGQGVGIKTERDVRVDVVRQVIARTMTEGGDLFPLVQQLKAWIQAGRKNDLPSEILEQMMAANDGKGLSMHGVHAVLAVADYLAAKDKAQKSGDDSGLKRFETFMYLEADGKTNGPINALMLLAPGQITPEFLDLVKKGGVFFGELGRTLNSMSGEPDLYGTSSARTQVEVAELGHELARTNKLAHAQLQTLFRVISALGMDVKIEGDTLKIERGASKNPLTISIYGSGAMGIAGNVAGEMIDLIYEKLSEHTGSGKSLDDLTYTGSDEHGSFTQDLKSLLSLKPYRDRDNGKMKLARVDPGQHDLQADPHGFKFSPEQRKTLQANVLHFLVTPMRQAIEATAMGHVRETVETLQRATQIQSIVFKALFRNAVIQKLAEKQLNPDKYPDFQKGDFLSQAELDEIRRSLLRYSPFIDTGTQSYLLSGAEKSDLFETVELTVDGKKIKVSMPESFSRSLSDDLATPAFVYGPTVAGVKVTPTLVIGSGDGQTMLNLATMKDAPDRAGKVFDGFNMAADMIDEYSRLANQAQFEAWTKNTNPVRAVLESFQAFVDSDPTASLLDPHNAFNIQLDTFIYEMSQADEGVRKPTDRVSPERVREMLQESLAALSRVADETDARRQLFSEMPLSIDQMASAESPYVTPGQGEMAALVGLSSAEQAERMNRRLEQILAEQAADRRLAALDNPGKSEDKSEKTAVETDNPKFAAAVDELALPDGDSGARVLRPEALDLMLDTVGKDFSPVHREMLTASLALLKDSGYRLVFGSPDQLDAWEQAHNADRFVPDSNDGYGKIDPVAKLILASNLAHETVVHELIHAATFSKVKAFYEAPGSLAPEDRQAIEHLQGLMNGWLAQDFANEDAVTRDARRQAYGEVVYQQRLGNDAAALNEFMAWVLANTNLAKAAARTKVQTPWFRSFGKALQALKNLIWGGKNAAKVNADDTLLNALRFNTRVLMATPSPVDNLRAEAGALTLNHSPVFGNNQRLIELREAFLAKVVNYIDAVPAEKLYREAGFDNALYDAGKLADLFVAHGFAMDMQQFSTFTAVQAAMMLDVKLNANALSRLQTVYDHVVQLLEPSALQDDPDSHAPDQVYLGQERYKVLNGVYGGATDAQGRSSLLSSFLALALVHDGFRQTLAGLETPKSLKSRDKTLDAYLSNWGVARMDALSRILSGEKGVEVQAAMDSLTRSLLANVGDQRTFAETAAENGIDGVDRYLRNNLQALSEKGYQAADKVLADPASPKLLQGGARFLRLVSQLVSESRAEEAALGLTKALNQGQGLQWLREVAADVVGRTRENAPLFDMISRVRSFVQQTRQQFRDHLPKTLADKFSRALSDAEKTALFHGLARTDLAALYAAHGVQGALALLVDDSRRSQEIRTLEASIQALDPARFAKLREKAKQLAHYLNTGEHGVRLLRNAEAVARLFGEQGYTRAEVDPGLVAQLDRLTTLYAVDGLDAGHRELLQKLHRKEADGLAYVLSYLNGLRVDEKSKLIDEISRNNHYKGYVPSEQQPSVSLVVAKASEHERLVGMGYVKLGEYLGSSADHLVGKRAYYFTPVTGRAPFNQGVLQMVHRTASGIDPNTGYTTRELTAGRIDDPKAVARILRQLNNQRQTTENLLPVYDADGDVRAFERGVDPQQTLRLNKSGDLLKMMGAWAGRLVEEQLAQEVNRELVETLHGLWLQGKKDGRVNEFVDLSRLRKTDDPVLHEVWGLIPHQTRQLIRERFGSEGFRVRRDLLNDAVGYRSASVGDLFTGNGRWKPAVSQHFQKIAYGILGDRAYGKLVTAERVVQDAVADAKVMIVVKSIVVPAGNMISNMYQLLARGVPFRDVVKGMGAKTALLNDYINNRKLEIDLQADLKAAQGRNDLVAVRKLETRIRAIQDSYKRSAIWPLIQAGEFSAISDGGVTAEDVTLANGKWVSYVEHLVEKLPTGIKTVGRYALITRDTALFQGLAKAIQYGDFLAKAVLYDDLTERKGLSSEEALVQVSEEFVNYNRLAGRSRQYLESVGLLWFYNFKLRSMKTAASMLRNQPFRALLATAAHPHLGVIGNIGLPTTDNFATLLGDGNLGWSIGPQMGLNSHNLSPWPNLVF